MTNSVQQTAASIRTDAANAVAGAHAFAVVIGLAIAVVPLTPVLAATCYRA